MTGDGLRRWRLERNGVAVRLRGPQLAAEEQGVILVEQPPGVALVAVPASCASVVATAIDHSTLRALVASEPERQRTERLVARG